MAAIEQSQGRAIEFSPYQTQLSKETPGSPGGANRSDGSATPDDEPDKQTYSARNWNPKFKLLISLSAIASYFVITLATSIYIASIPGIMREFRVSQTLAISPITFYAMGFVIGPMFTAALSEEFGRQYIYKTSLLLHLVFTIVGGAAPNFRTIAVARAISGIVGSPSVTVFAGVLNDLWKMPEDKAAGALFVLYGLGGTLATEIGPIAGESIVADRDWRWSFWLTAMLVGVCFLSMVFVPETYEPEIRRKALKLPRGDWRKTLGPAFARPARMLFVEPIILPTAFIVTMGQVVVFVFYASYPLVLQSAYNFSSYEVGLAFLPLMVGSLLALPVLSWAAKRREKYTEKHPEQTLTGAMVAAVLLPISLFWLAWTARPSIHWICPLLAGIPYGMGFSLSQLIYPLYKNEFYGAELGASAFAVDVAMRYTFSCVFPLFTIQMVDAMKFEWAISLCAFIMLAMAPVPWLLKIYGPSLRHRSRYVKTGETGSDEGAA
ncbi:MFS general substrate transporter [Penicillium alfredii]|uniref:MFS general substrate transporter n=1 Tax=Penicillium alfredii TaxID=1506179 RepID=A0A9W9EGG4_9EURO|nr:MFS general substrate transporter [Penicillium alfredii]KAJ5081336.1 MFS general substrate transporter [Penicillium alfredii]